MKQCPRCKTTYTDVTLRFCLADGAALIDLSGEQPTVSRQTGTSSAAETIAMQHGADQMRVDIPPQTVPQPTYQPQVSAPNANYSGGGIFKVIMVVIGLGIFAVLAVAVGTFIYYNMNRTEVASNVANKDVKPPNPSPTTDDKDELRDQIANLEKLINEQKNNKQPVNIPFPDKTGSLKTARVNSPGDGFLALRTLPSSEFGERIMKIPHGATISVGGCGAVVRPVSRTGRWCQASYNGNTGWVFDAYLVY